MPSDLLEASAAAAQFGRISPLVRSLRTAVRNHGVGRLTAALVAVTVGASVLLSSALHLSMGLPVTGGGVMLATVIPLALTWAIGWLNLTLIQLLDSSERNYRYQVNHDVLTTLNSRSGFRRHARTLLAIERGTNPLSGTSCWALIIDIDHFKSINDELGHQAGDLALCHIAKTVRGALRPEDVVGRYGGDEIVALLVDLEIAEAAALAQRLRLKIKNTPLILPDGTAQPLTVGVGLARVNHDEAEPSSALARANAALLSAKRGGCDQLQVAAPDHTFDVCSAKAADADIWHHHPMSDSLDHGQQPENSADLGRSTFDQAPAIARMARRWIMGSTVNRATVLLTAGITLASLSATLLPGLLFRFVEPHMLLVATIIPIIIAGLPIWFTNILISQLDRSERLHEHFARHDALTGVLTRRAFFEETARFVKQCRDGRDECWIVMLDLDHLKQINDRYGYATGDEALRQGVAVLRKAIRQTDIVGRYGGDEFIALLADIDRAGVMAVAKRLLKTLAAVRVHGVNEPGIGVSASIGLAKIEAQDKDMDGPLGRADDALREAKAQGRNRIAVAEPKSAGGNTIPFASVPGAPETTRTSVRQFRFIA